MTIPIGKYMHAEHLGCEPEVYTIHARDLVELKRQELVRRPGRRQRQLQENGYCHFLEMGDWNIGHGLIWDKCKECGINMSEISNSEIVETANKYFPLSFSTKELREKLIEVFDVCESEDKLRERLNYLSKSPAIIACEDDIFAITGRDIYGNDLNRKDKK